MLEAKDIRLARETVRELRSQGQEERASALEAVLAAATSAVAAQGLDRPDEYVTTGQAARALGVSLQTIKNWVAAGRLQAVRLGGRTLVHREALLGYLDKLREGRPEPRVRTAPENAAEVHRRELVFGGLPADKLASLEALHQKLEAGQRLSRAEHAAIVAVEREMLEVTGQRLQDWSSRPKSGSS